MCRPSGSSPLNLCTGRKHSFNAIHFSFKFDLKSMFIRHSLQIGGWEPNWMKVRIVTYPPSLVPNSSNKSVNASRNSIIPWAGIAICDRGPPRVMVWDTCLSINQSINKMAHHGIEWQQQCMEYSNLLLRTVPVYFLSDLNSSGDCP